MLFKILHTDHGISQRQMGLVKDVLGDRLTGLEGFFIQQITIPEEMGPVPCGLYGPAMDDAPVAEEEVKYQVRFSAEDPRTWSSRMVDRPLRPVSYVQAIGIIDDHDCCVLFTVYGGPLAPQNPDDPDCEDVPVATEWWAKHALASADEE